jgi:hypothetical protein
MISCKVPLVSAPQHMSAWLLQRAMATNERLIRQLKKK